MIRLSQNIYSNFSAFKVLVGVSTKTTVLSTRLGWLWWILDPLFLMGVYYFLIKGIFGRGGEDYHVFVLTGIVSWQFFARALTDSMSAIPANRQILQQSGFPLSVLVAIPIVARFFFAVIGVFIVMLFNYPVISLNTLAVFPVLIVIAILSYGLGLFASVINVYVSDIKQLITYVLRAGFFCTPILYPASRLLDSPNIPDAIKAILKLNPMMWVITALREVLLEGRLYNWQEFTVVLFVTLLIAQLGLLWMRICAPKIKKML